MKSTNDNKNTYTHTCVYVFKLFLASVHIHNVENIRFKNGIKDESQLLTGAVNNVEIKELKHSNKKTSKLQFYSFTELQYVGYVLYVKQ